MSSLLSTIGIGIVVFASTNIDDIFVLAAFFADSRVRRRSVVVGQFLGVGALVLASALAAMLALAIPEGWVALLGLVPLFLGLRRLLMLRRGVGGKQGNVEAHLTQDKEHMAEHRFHSHLLTVAAVTAANGGDNLGVYIPLFATAPDSVGAYALIFAAMTAIWCALGYALVNNRVLGGPIRRYGQVALPFVLIALGICILSDALVLFR